MKIDHVSYTQRLEPRPPDAVTTLVIHCTELPNLATARSYAEKIHYSESRTGNCGHYYIDRDGQCYEYAPIDRVAHHVRDNNGYSVGIELINRGRYPNWYAANHQKMEEPYPDEQVSSLISLINDLTVQTPSISYICGHEDLDTASVVASDDSTQTVRRKLDPGPLFPWTQVMAQIRLKRMTP